MPQTNHHVLRAKRWELPESFLVQPKAVITVTAPAGYGKSTLLSEWREDIAARHADIIWLVAAEDDHEGDKLMIDLLHGVAPVDAERSQMLLGGSGAQGKRAVIMALLAEIASRSHCTVLFIDDVHWLSASTSILGLLIAHQPEGLTLIFSGRKQDASLVSGPLLEGRLTQFTATHLAFEEAEVAAILRQHDVEPRSALVNHIAERTGGWPAVVRLIAMTLQDDPEHQDAFLRKMGNQQELLAGYLSEVLLSRLPERSAAFLLGISLLRRFNATLAAAVTDMTDAGKLLQDLERRALPFSRSGDPALPYALHPLVREFLLARATREDPATLVGQTRRALEWMNANDQVDAAIDLSLDVGDIDGAAALIDRYSQREARSYGRHSTFLYWTNKLPPEHLNRFPKIQCIRVWSLNVLRRYAEADIILDGLDTTIAQAKTGQGLIPFADAADAERMVELERNIQLLLRDQWVGLEEKGHSWLARWPHSNSMDTAIAHVIIGSGLCASSDFENSLQHLRQAQSIFREIDAWYATAWTDMWTVTTLTKQGRIRQALYECENAIDEVKTDLGNQAPAESMLQAIRSFLLYEMNRIDEASVALEDGLTVLAEQCSVDSLIMGYAALARIQNAQGLRMDALDTLAEGEILGWAHDLPRAAISASAERVDMLLRDGEINQARLIWEDLKRTVPRQCGSRFDNVLRDRANRIEARMALTTGKAKDALKWIEPALEHATSTHQRRKQVQLLLLKALAAQIDNDNNQAYAIVKQSLDVAMSQGYMRLFADEGPKIQQLLISYFEHQGDSLSPISTSYMQQILNTFGSEDIPSPDTKATTASNALTARELEILRKLESGLSNRELADILFITEGTLKWHLRNIYSKLGVGTRLAAVSKGRQAGLIT